MENYVVLSQGFLIFVLFDFVFRINLKNKPRVSVPDCMPVASPTSPTGDIVCSTLAPWKAKYDVPRSLAIEELVAVFTFLKN